MNNPLEIPEHIIGPDPCQVCGGEYGQHETGCRMSEPIPTHDGIINRLAMELVEERDSLRATIRELYELSRPSVHSNPLAAIKMAIAGGKERDELKLKLKVAREALDKAMGLMDTPEHNQDSEWNQQRDEVKEALSQLNESGVQKSTTKGTLEAFKVIMDTLPKADGEAQRDKARLNWLAENAVFAASDTPALELVVPAKLGHSGDLPTFVRAAIDSAMSADTKGTS